MIIQVALVASERASSGTVWPIPIVRSVASPIRCDFQLAAMVLKPVEESDCLCSAVVGFEAKTKG